jgi:ribosomal protein S18 acetylase RimI-like enzyme
LPGEGLERNASCADQRRTRLVLMADSLPGGISLQKLDAAAVRNDVSRLVWIWAQATPGAETTHRERLIEHHSQCQGFRCLTASCDNVIVGFAYGLNHGQGTGLGSPGEIASVGSHDLLQEKVLAGLVQPDWLDAFDIADLQVLPEHRRRGIGEGLVRALCDGLPSGRVVLTVADGAEDAKHLYQRLGFQDVLRTMPPMWPPVWLTVMGTTLPLPAR